MDFDTNHTLQCRALHVLTTKIRHSKYVFELQQCKPIVQAKVGNRCIFTLQMVVVVVDVNFPWWGHRLFSIQYKRPYVQPLTKSCVHQNKVEMYHVRVCMRWAVFVQFSLVRRPHCPSRPQHWPSFSATHIGCESVYTSESRIGGVAE